MYDQVDAVKNDLPTALAAAAFATEMNAMTRKERELIFEKIHGVADVIKESPDRVASSLQKMREALQQISRQKKRALDRAMFLKHSLVTDDQLHLKYLRANRFNPDKAAINMCKYFTHKLGLFGELKLVKKITLDDFGPAEVESGFLQFPPVNHQGLRAQYFTVARNGSIQDDWKAFTHYLWYQLEVALEDDDVQKRGVVSIVNACGEWERPMSCMVNYFRRAASLYRDCAVRTRSFHICYEDHQASMLPFINFIHKSVASRELKIRERHHVVESATELEHSLKNYGIYLPKAFMLGEGIFSRLNVVDAYLKFQRDQEQMAKRQESLKQGRSDDDATIPDPNPIDVLMGRGYPYQCWHGNVRLCSMVEKYTESYMQVENRLEKTDMAYTIVERIENREGGRFLQRTDTGWVPASTLAKRRKVSQLLRADLRSRKATGTPTTNSPGTSSIAFQNGEEEDDGFTVGDDVDICSLEGAGDSSRSKRLRRSLAPDENDDETSR